MMEMNIPWSITPQEADLARACIAKTLDAGADAVRISLNKSVMDLYSLRNGILEKVTHNGDRSLMFCIFKGGRFGTFSINRLDPEQIDAFIREAVAMVSMLAPDPFRKLPSPERLAKDATTGLETGLYDPAYATMTPEKRLELALQASYYRTERSAEKSEYSIISEETEYSDSLSDLLVLDSGGLEARHLESSFEIGCEYTIQGSDGNKYSGYWWDSSPSLGKLQVGGICRKALERAAAQIGAGSTPTGKYTMVVENEVASKMINPLLGALGGYSLQQNNSFLVDSLGKKIFHEGFNLSDTPRTEGANGARLFDSEGVATVNGPVIESGVVKKYFLNTYIAGKMGLEPTVEECIKPVVEPYWGLGGEKPQVIDKQAIMKACGEGILVTGFNGGNCNSATGDFSYGIEGFAFSDGSLRPVHGMVVTGNMIKLWNSLLAAGEDTRPCMNKQVPTLAFKDMDFSA